MTMKKKLLLMMFISVMLNLSAQVGINTISPDGSAALDIVSTDKGILIPRMTTVQKLAITSPAHALLVYDTDMKQIYQNAATPVSPVWVALGSQVATTKFFYMPSITIDVSVIAIAQTKNLYDEYKQQFTGAVATQFAKNPAAPASIPFFPNATDLDYYITRYDNVVLDNVSVSNAGVMMYDVKATSQYKSFMNVVFVVK